MNCPIQVVITDCPWEDDSVERSILEHGGAQVSRARCRTPEDVLAVGRDADALLVGWAPITRPTIDGLKKCRLIMRYGTGYDNIDLEAATAARIAVAINAEYCVEEVATHAFALLLSCHRQISSLQAAVQRGEWDPLRTLRPFPPLTQQTVGILGLGRIGRRFAELVKPLAKRVLIYDPAIGESIDRGEYQTVPFQELLSESDYISIHMPLTASTRLMFNKDVFARMKRGAYIINCARGPIVDEEALVESVKKRHLGGAALDVFCNEPLPPDHPLRTLPQVIITPHAAWYSIQADHQLRALPAQNILRFFQGTSIPTVNKIT